MSEEYIELPKERPSVYRMALDPRLQELLQDHKSTWEANSKGGEPNHWEECK
jgi:hypothetical protein